MQGLFCSMYASTALPVPLCWSYAKEALLDSTEGESRWPDLLRQPCASWSSDVLAVCSCNDTGALTA